MTGYGRVTLPIPLPCAENAENRARNARMNELNECHWESPVAKAARNPRSLRLANRKILETIQAGLSERQKVTALRVATRS